MELAQQLDDYGKPAWIGVMILGFMCFWPIGLMILGYLIWSGRMGCSSHHKRHWSCFGPGNKEDARRYSKRSSGNAAFDEYRAQTLKRLEDEFDEFQDFLEQLRMAKDKEQVLVVASQQVRIFDHQHRAATAAGVLVERLLDGSQRVLQGRRGAERIGQQVASDRLRHLLGG